MPGKLLGKVSPADGSWVHGIVDGNLAILMVEPGIDVLSTFLENLLTEDHGRG